jgi:SPP1 gp7 family putative phage head morphogenesis protein
MGKIAARNKRNHVARKLRPPVIAEHRYVVALKGVMRGLHHDTMTWLKPRIGRLAAKADQGGGAGTQLSTELAAHVDGLVNALAPKVVTPFMHLANAVETNNRKAMRSMGLDVRGQIGPHIQQFQEWNQSLIKSAAREYADQIAAVLDDPETWGLRIEEIEALLVKRGGVSESRAQLIARDQTQKLNANVNQFRQRNAGVTSYEWSTSLDERVRDEHAANEGQEFAWGNPPPDTGDPGDDVNCRCVAVPVIPELADDEAADVPPMAAEE